MTKFSVLVFGERLTYDGLKSGSGPGYVEMYKNAEGKLISINGLALRQYGKEYPLPIDALLVAISPIGKTRDLYTPRR